MLFNVVCALLLYVSAAATPSVDTEAGEFVIGADRGSPPAIFFLPATPPSFATIQDLVTRKDYKAARAIIDQELAKEPPTQIRSALFLMRAATDALLKDVRSFRTDMAEAANYSTAPEMLLPQLIIHASDFDEETAVSLSRQFAQLHRVVDGGLDETLVWKLMQLFYQSGKRKIYDELVVSLASVSFGTAMSKDELYREAAEILSTRGDVKEAVHYAQLIRERGGIIDILTDRRYERMWPELERLAGERLENLGRAQLAAAELEFKKEPERLDLMLQLMRAYVDLGMLEEADKLGREVGRTRDELMSLTDTTAYIVDTHATILRLTEGVDAADRRRAALVETWTPQRAFVINMAINRIALLFTAHRYEQALALLDDQKWQLEGFSSPYAKQLLRALRLGSLIGLGRREEALDLLPDIAGHANDAPAATLGALLLAGDDVRAEKFALKWLEDPRTRITVLKLLRLDDTSKADDPLAAEAQARLRARPAVAKAFDLYGRDLPETFRRSF